MTENLEKTKGRNARDPIAINCFECAEEHRQLAEWLKDYKRLLEQESKTDVLDKIRAEIVELRKDYHEFGWAYDDVLELIDKYKESEGEE